MIADLTMSIDNVLAIAGASKGDFRLIVFGLAVSIPFVVLSSNLLSKPDGSISLDDVPGRLDPGRGRRRDDPYRSSGGETLASLANGCVKYAVEAVLVVAVIVAGEAICKRGANCP